MAVDEKAKYQDTLYKLNRILNKISYLNNSLSLVNGKINNSLVVDGEGYQSPKIRNCKTTLNNVSYILVTYVIDSIKEKIK